MQAYLEGADVLPRSPVSREPFWEWKECDYKVINTKHIEKTKHYLEVMQVQNNNNYSASNILYSYKRDNTKYVTVVNPSWNWEKYDYKVKEPTIDLNSKIEFIQKEAADKVKILTALHDGLEVRRKGPSTAGNWINIDPQSFDQNWKDYRYCIMPLTYIEFTS